MMADKDVEVSEAIMSPSPVPQSVFVAGHQLDSPTARPTDSGFRVCKANCRAYDQPNTVYVV